MYTSVYSEIKRGKYGREGEILRRERGREGEIERKERGREIVRRGREE